MSNFTLADTLGILKASLAFLPFVVAPGYVVGWALDLFEFRQRRPILRLILAVTLTIAICPMLSYLLARFLEPGLWAFYIGVFAFFAVLLVKEARRTKLQSVSKFIWIALGLLAVWGVIAVASLDDLQIDHELYPPLVAYDHAVRTVMTSALARHVPPNNPFFANAGAPLRYHYLWLFFCSLPMKVLHLSPRYVVYAGVVWCGVSLLCSVALGVKFLLGVQSDIERATLLAIGLLCVTGLDILPTIYIRLAGRAWIADMERWNDVQITSWAGSVLWVPHNVAALVACFFAFLLLRHQADTRRWAAAPVIVAGMAFASAAGMSVYVTFTFVIAVGLWLLASITRKDWFEVVIFTGAGLLALLWALPFLLDLGGPGAGAAFSEFGLRPFSLGVEIIRKLGLNPQTQFALALTNFAFLPINYMLELGFFLVVGILRLRKLVRGQIEASANELAAWTLVATSFLIGTFLCSSTTNKNDLGWRCFLPAQLILLLWGTTLVHDYWFQRSTVKSHATPQSASHLWTRAAVGTLLILGLLGTTYQVWMLRMFPVLLDRGVIAGAGINWVDPDQFGKRAYAFRSAYQILDAEMPSSAVLQANPATVHPVLHMLYSGRDSAAATPMGDPLCGTAFGGDPVLCVQRGRRIAELFELPNGGNLDATCREYGIDAIVVENSDPVWQEPASWIWYRTPAVANDYVRAFRCGASTIGDHR